MNYGKKHDLPFGIMDVAGLLRLNIRRRAPGQVYVDCPICGDRRGKMNLNTAKDLWRCNYCGEGGGMLSLYGDTSNDVSPYLKQYEQRLMHLPEGSKQSVQIDLRSKTLLIKV